MWRSCFPAETTTMPCVKGGSVLQNFGGATFRCFITAYHPELDAHGPGTRPGGRQGPWGACYVLRRYMPFSGAGKGLRTCARGGSRSAGKGGRRGGSGLHGGKAGDSGCLYGAQPARGWETRGQDCRLPRGACRDEPRLAVGRQGRGGLPQFLTAAPSSSMVRMRSWVSSVFASRIKAARSRA